MTFKEAQRKIPSGLTLKKRDGEYIVNFKGEKGDLRAYFTNDLSDAVGTAKMMSHEQECPFGNFCPFKGDH